MKRRYGYVTENYAKWDVVEVDISTVLFATSKHNRLDDREQNARVTISKDAKILRVH